MAELLQIDNFGLQGIEFDQQLPLQVEKLEREPAFASSGIK